MKNFKKLFDFLIILLCLSIVLRIIFKFFVLHEVSFENFLFGFFFFGTILIVNAYIYFNPRSSLYDTLFFAPMTKGDIALNIGSIVLGAIMIFTVLFEHPGRTLQWIFGFGGAFFFLGGISMFRLPEPKNIDEIRKTMEKEYEKHKHKWWLRK